MRKSMKWALGVTGVLTLIALWRPQAPPVVADVKREREARDRQWAEVTNTHAVAPALAPLPRALDRRTVEPASRDLFAAVQPPAPKPEPQPKVVPPPPPVLMAQPATPSAPQANYRFLGRMTNPEGVTTVYLAAESQVIEAKLGERLASGYVVEAVNADSVVLLYPSVGARVVIPLPAEPAS